MKKKVTIYDIARELNLNVSTVSRALNDSDLVKMETRKKILAVAKKLKYRPNPIARSLFLKKTRSIGLVYLLFESSMFHGIASGIESILEDNDYTLIVTDSKLNKDVEKKNIEVLINKMVDGIIILPHGPDFSYIRNINEAGIPVVTLGETPGNMDTYCVTNNPSRQIEMAVEYLINKGHKKIAYISARTGLSEKMRLHKYISSLRKSGIDFDSDLVFYSEPFISGGRETAKNIFNKNIDFSSIICWNDLIGAGVIDYCANNNIKIPDECSIIGMDNDLNFSPYLKVPLSSVHSYKRKLGIEAAKLILRILRNEEIKNKKVYLQPYIVERDSVKNLNQE